MPKINSSYCGSFAKPGNGKHFYRRWRLIKDAAARYAVVCGGLGVIVAIVLIFFYLVYVVYPLFLEAEAESAGAYELPGKEWGGTLHLAMEEQNEVAVRFTDKGFAVYFDVKTGKVIDARPVGVPDGAVVSSFARGDASKGTVAFGLSDGRVILAVQKYKISYPDDVRVITPVLDYPLGSEPLIMDKEGVSLEKLAVQTDGDGATIVAGTADGRLLLAGFEKEESFLGDDTEMERHDALLEIPHRAVRFVMLDKSQRKLFLANEDGELTYLDVSDKSRPVIKQYLNVTEAGRRITSMEFLNGDISLLVGDSAGSVVQWSMVRDEQNRPALKKLRSFNVSGRAVKAIESEQRRKGFIAADEGSRIGIFHSTAERKLIDKFVARQTPVALALAPRASAFLLEDQGGKVHLWRVMNEHPEVSLTSLWREVWYESYPKPDYIWQSSSASNDFEPKFSLTPLVFGTLKAAFYAMLVAVPLAICGAIYTAYFMAPAMRAFVKPSIEIMEALPTVILGFLAGLWLAPFVEQNLAEIFAILIVIPLAVILFAFFWQKLPERIRHLIPEGWDAALLIPVIVVASWLALLASTPIESMFFGGDLRNWLGSEMGVNYDQRNSLVVGMAMGFAVIPTIFSIAEDAIFSVPGHLTYGSLALGATPWQTMTRVVLLTASPGIFSAVMIGFGRAVGETMIVLMATGNTPVMDLSLFQGMRTLSANIAVEMPESEVDSTHYRVLFLAALVLFLFTFVFNTLAEVIRQRLRERYSSL